MSSLQGAQTSGPGDHPSHVIQIYPRLKQVTAQCLTLQVTAAQTTAAVIQHAVATLGIDTQRSYSLLELKESDGEETVLEDGEHPVNRYFLWPPETHRWHPKSKGYYFILQPLLQEGEAWLEELVEDYDDLCRLPELSEDALLQTLRKRFYKKKIYTYASSILVAVNPFKFLPCYYNPKYVMMYENQPLGKLSPHIFAVANVAYHAMLNRRLDQCIVISGESGSGKTESSSYLVHCLTALSQKRYASGVVRTLLGAGPVLEAFGNATTAQNNNSSRFGKFVQLNYLESGVIRGAIIEKYLLEKSRLVCRDTSERNYHVFYYLLIGASKEERKEFSLLQPQEYNYLQQEDLSIEGEEKLRHEYKRLHQAMEMVGFLASTKKLIFSILSAILYLGNVTYTVSEEGEVIKVGPDDVLSTLSDLLKVKQELLVNALTQRRAVVSNDTLVLPYMLKEATTARDSMAKSLYSALFDWIVLHINHTLLNRRDMEESVSCLSIGILDIFGFENFQTNSFEQFCINYTNEKLHHYFSQYVFNRQQEEYLSEGISWSTIAYGDNEGVINMFSKKPTGFFHLLDEESNLPQATDGTLLDKLKQHHKDNPLFVGTAVMEPAFVIQHFAGRVKYQIKDFRVKNTDHMRPDVVLLLRGSERAFLRQLVCSSPAALFRWGVLRATIRITAAFRALARRGAQTGRPTRPNMTLDFSFDHSDEQPLEKLMDSHSLKHIVALTVNGRTSQLVLHPHQRKKPPSISAQFQASLCNLLDSVGKAEPFFIRCIRSNAEKREMYFDEALVLHQIKYSGMLEMVRIQKAGFGAKYTFEEFVKKFWVLMPKGAAATSEDITKLFQNMGVDQSTYQMGKTKVFLKESQRQRLQETLNKEVMRSVVILQRWFRCCLIRMHFLNKKDAALLIQRCWREFYETNQGRAAIIIQTAWRTSLQKSESQDEGSREEISKSGPGRQRYDTLRAPTLTPEVWEEPRLVVVILRNWRTKEQIQWLLIVCFYLLQDPTISLFPLMSLESPAALAASSKQPQHRPGQDSFRVSNPSILISRATRGKQLKAALDRDVANSKELRHLDEFLGSQVMELNARIKDLSATESIFLSATSEFRVIIKCMYAYPKPQVSYIDLLKGYHNKVNRLASPHRLSEVTLVVNLFQSMLDGFIRGLVKQEEAEPVKKTKKRRKKEKCMENPLDHMFSTYQVNIMQSCDLCGSYIWGMEKAYMCSACKLICHKKCLAKIITDCLTRCDSSTSGSLHFGVDVSVLSSPAQPVPQVLEMLLVYVEMNGLDTEGIYRKSGSACRARELHQILETNPETASLENYPIHTITGLVKRWLRELPEPLMTFNLYNDFLHAAELPEKSERIRAIYQKVDELPESNYSTLERLIFHLVKVAKEEVHNRMTASSLAIVFAPCIMRSPDADDPFLGMKDVNKTTQCVEVLIMEQFRRYTEKMQNIKELEYAETLAIHQLQLKRQNTVRIAEKDAEKDAMQQINFDNDYEKSLIERIKSIKEEKEDLACTLPDLEQETSDDNLDNQWSVSSDSLGSDRLGSLDSEGQ
uniref:Myosin IXb n=1 Tax=Gadus morhua TaxID=8049 RepID=A0A8C4ZFI9_GADMO